MMTGDKQVAASIIICLLFFSFGVLSGSSPITVDLNIGDIHVNLNGFLANAALSIATGIISGLYVSLIVTRYLRFQEYVTEIVDEWNQLEPVWEESSAPHTSEIHETRTVMLVADRLSFVSTQLLHLGHRSAGILLQQRSDELTGEMSQCNVFNLHTWISDTERELRSLKPSYWALMRLFRVTTIKDTLLKPFKLSEDKNGET